MFLSFYFNRTWVLDLRVNSSFWCISSPFANKDFIFLWEKVRTLSLPHIVNPMAFKMITTSLSKHAVATSFALKPHAFIDIAIFVNHSAFTMRHAIHPHAVVTISWLIEHCASALLTVVIPIACVLSPEFVFRVCHPESALTMTLVLAPASFVLVTVCIVLNAKACLFIITPITNVLVWSNPLIALLWSVLI